MSWEKKQAERLEKWFSEPQRILRECHNRLEHELDSLAQSQELKQLLQLLLRFSIDTSEAVAEQVEKGRIPQARILLRSWFETGVGFRWASKNTDGWKRLIADCATGRLQWANKAQDVPMLGSRAKRIAEDPTLRKQQENAKPLPDVRKMLEDLDKCEGKPDSDFWKYCYLAVYCRLSESTHGTYAALVDEANYWNLSPLSAIFVQCSILSVEAVHDFLEWDDSQVRGEFESLCKMVRATENKE